MRREKNTYCGDFFLGQPVHQIAGYFIEVKTVSCSSSPEEINAKIDNYQLDDNIHPWKLQRLARVFQTYLLEKRISAKTEWQFDIIIVFLDIKDKISRVRWLKDIII